MSTAATTPPPATLPSSPVLDPLKPWNERINLFATAVGKTSEQITGALVGLVGDPGPAALDALSDPAAVLDVDLQSVFVGGEIKIPLGIFRKNLALLRGPKVSTEVPGPSERLPSFELLPSVPEDDSFLAMLQVGGVLKPAKTEVISAIKAALAHKLGIYELPNILIEKMETFADEQEEPVGESFFKLRKLVTTRNYGEILSVLGVEGSFVSDARKKTFLNRLDEHLWAEIASFYSRLTSWQESWMASAGNPGLALSMLAMSTGGRGAMMPPGMMQPPETSAVRDAATELVNKINKVFSGVGVPVARALAFDATRIKGVLEEPSLPVAIGAANREQMLKMLGVTVGADYVRLERNLTRFVLAAMELPKVPSGNEEYSYLGAMLQLGASIPWDKLPGAAPVRAGIGAGPGRRERL